MTIQCTYVRIIWTQLYTIGDIPDAITDLYAPPHLITSSSFVVHWSEPSSDVVCGPVQYIITVSTGGIITWNITINRTTYTATGLCSNTSYKVNVFADNIAGNSIPTTIRIMTIPSGKLVNSYSCYDKNLTIPAHNIMCGYIM